MTKVWQSTLPERENLRQAVRWISEQRQRDAQMIEDASRRFDLSPLDEEFLLRHFLVREPGNRSGAQ